MTQESSSSSSSHHPRRSCRHRRISNSNSNSNSNSGRNNNHYLFVLLLIHVGFERSCCHAFSFVSSPSSLFVSSSTVPPALLHPLSPPFGRNRFSSLHVLHATTLQENQEDSSPVSRNNNNRLDSKTATTKRSRRKVAQVEKFARLPVWPVWMGVLLFFVSRTLGDAVAATLEDTFGGRVCPNFFPTAAAASSSSDPTTTFINTSPFIMLVHHRHSFSPLDPIRWVQKTFILPEGFPAHAHRGFTTLTYFLKGGFSHRDSMGVAQHYGQTSSSTGSSTTTTSHHSQWLFTGAGLLHEEMFNDSPQQELYQLWVNVPSARKLDSPTVHLLGEEECPIVVPVDGSSRTVVLAGRYDHGDNMKATAATAATATTPIMSDLSIFHVTVQPGKSWSYIVPPTFETVILYIRQGSCRVEGTELPVHHTAYLDTTGDRLELVSSAPHGVDLLILAGTPLRDPVVAQGSMVMTSSTEINQAYRDYQMGWMGMPWSHELSDEEWKQHVAQYPCRYQYSDVSNNNNNNNNNNNDTPRES